MKGMTSARSKNTNRVKTLMSAIFRHLYEREGSAIEAKNLAAPDLSAVSNIRALLTNSSGAYVPQPPILYRDEIIDSTNLFLNPCLPKVLLGTPYPGSPYLYFLQIAKLVLFGPSSLVNGSGKGSGKRSGPRAIGKRWGLKSVTPGLIAYCAVTVRVLLKTTLPTSLELFRLGLRSHATQNSLLKAIEPSQHTRKTTRATKLF
jgi:hypothetical protein